MDAFENPFWNLDQVTFWAWLRSRQWVRSIPKDALFLDLVLPNMLEERENKIDEDLWRKSGWDKKQAITALLVLPESPDMRCSI